jgi:hypothetical protein
MQGRACGGTALFRGESGAGLAFADGDSAHAAKLIPSAVAIPTNAAHNGGGIVAVGWCRVVGSLFRVRFHSQTLRSLQRRRQGVWTGLGTLHLRLQTAVQVFEFGTAFVRIRR